MRKEEPSPDMLAYGRQPRPRARRRIPRTVAIMMLAGGVLWLGNGVERALRIRRAERACAEYTIASGKVTYTTEPELAKRLGEDANYRLHNATADLKTPECYAKYQSLHFGAFPSSHVLLLTRLRGPGSNQVQRMVGIFISDSGTLLAREMDPERRLIAFGDEPVATWVPGESTPLYDWATYYAGTVDSNDPSRCVIPYESDSCKGEIVGQLSAAGMLNISRHEYPKPSASTTARSE